MPNVTQTRREAGPSQEEPEIAALAVAVTSREDELLGRHPGADLAEAETPEHGADGDVQNLDEKLATLRDEKALATLRADEKALRSALRTKAKSRAMHSRAKTGAPIRELHPMPPTHRQPDAEAATTALSLLSTNEREQPCWGCGKAAPPPDQKPFHKCRVCVERKYALCAHFCDLACLKKHRMRHLEWHAEQDGNLDEQCDIGRLGRDATHWVAAAPDEYSKLCARADQVSSPPLPSHLLSSPLISSPFRFNRV
jgi:hypothetical protein